MLLLEVIGEFCSRPRRCQRGKLYTFCFVTLKSSCANCGSVPVYPWALLCGPMLVA